MSSSRAQSQAQSRAASRQSPTASRDPSMARQSRTRRNRTSGPSQSPPSSSPEPQREFDPPSRSLSGPPSDRRTKMERQVDEDRNAPLPGIGEVFDPNRSAAAKAGRREAAAKEQRGGEEGEGDDNPLKLRIDVNLDVALELKAQVHGDVTLQLLG